MRADAMVGIGTRLGLAPPAELGPVPKLLSIGLITEWPEAALYIGRGDLKHRRAAGAWSSGFQPGPDSSSDVCVRRYAAWLASFPAEDILAWGRSLQGCVL
eukprot:136997-Heterocapsa_arctica.AAC.1